MSRSSFGESPAWRILGRGCVGVAIAAAAVSVVAYVLGNEVAVLLLIPALGVFTAGIGLLAVAGPAPAPRPAPSGRGAGSLLLAAGALQAGAAWIRWLPCIADRGSLECAAAESHLFDYALVSEPFEAVPGAVVLAAFASFLLCAFWIRCARAAAGLARAASAASAALTLLVGGGQLTASLSGGGIGVLDYGASLVVGMLAYLAPIVAAGAMIAAVPAGRIRTAWISVLIGAVASGNLVEYAILQSLVPSYDSPIGTGAFPPAALVVGGLFFLRAASSVGVERSEAALPSG